jgi:hypothetical protein
MSKYIIEKIKLAKGKSNSILTEDFRKLVKEKLGELDTATSFMYLFRRFGVPSFDNKDEYKILYDYRFKYDDIIITIHASYHEFVYFSLHVASFYFSDWNKKRVDFIHRLINENQSSGIAFMPYSDFFSAICEITPMQSKERWKIIDQEAQSYFTKEDYEYIDKQFSSKNPESKMFDMLFPFETYLCKKYRDSLSSSDVKELNHFIPTLSDVPELRIKCLSFIRELKKGAYVRDCAINIKGYDSAENKINKFISD